MADEIRALAYTALERCAAAGSYANLALDHTIKRHALTGVDRAFFTTLVYGTMEKQITIDYLLAQQVNRTYAGVDGKVKTILRLGAYQILFLDRVPDHAACNESVELAKKYAKHSASFVNGVLRSLAREKDALVLPPRDGDFALFLSVTYSAPIWLCNLWCTHYGKEKTEAILRAMATPPPITLSVNTLKITRAALLLDLAAEGINAVPADSERGIILPPRLAVSDLVALADGRAFVEDLASQAVVAALDAQPGDVVADVCACPGGKSFGTAIRMENVGVVESFDLHQSKLSLVESGAARLGITILTAAVRDGAKADPARAARYDRVLCDVPCSGLGVLAKKPDLRHKAEADIARLPEIQRNILATSADLVKVGGVLVYATCTLHPRENEENVVAFLAARPDFNMVETRTFFPDTDHTDGFFYAKFVRTENR